MPRCLVGIHTIGQTPRPDLERLLFGMGKGVELVVRGALDGMDVADLPRPDPDDYPLETRLRDGRRVVVGASFVESSLQRGINELDQRVAAHLVLCAGPFPQLSAGKALALPFDVALAELAARGLRRLEVVVPFKDQAPHSAARWDAAGHPCRVHVLDSNPHGQPVAHWLKERLGDVRAQAIVFDYVGFPPEILEQVRAELALPVLDLGHLAVAALDRILDTH